jgi:hypothetical protein
MGPDKYRYINNTSEFKIMNITEQLEILTAVKNNKKIQYQKKTSAINEWFDLYCLQQREFNFELYNYRIKPNQPTILHQYIIKEKNGNYKLSIYFYKSLEEAQENTKDTVIKAAEWTKIEIQE